MELPELKPWTSHMIFHWQPESLFEEDRRSNLWPLFWVILSAASLSSLIWLWIHLSKTASILIAHAPLDLTDILRAHDCKYRESLARLKKSKILIICLENPLREIYSKKLFQSLKNQMCPRKWGKRKFGFLPN